MPFQDHKASLYRSTPLVSPQSEIRLLKLLPHNEYGGPIDCRLITINLQKAPPFKALSYVWGASEDIEEIIVNGLIVTVRLNLALALRNLRGFLSGHGQPVKVSFLWVDALCINQEDLTEKSHQVARMGEIYRAAEQVVAWLGEQDIHTQLAIQTIGEIGAAMPHDFRLGEIPSEQWLGRLSHVWKPEQGVADEAFNRPLEALQHFLGSPYWSRSWIVQEIVLAKAHPVFLIGQTTLPYVALEKLMFLWDGILESSAIPYESRLAILAALSPRGNSLSSIYWLRNVMRKELGVGQIKYDWPQGILQMAADGLLATDPRDKVFAFCGLALTSMTPDYNKSVSHVYAQFAKEAIDRGMFSQLWHYSGIGLGTGLGTLYSLPSWVADLPAISQHRTTMLPLFCQGFTANKGLVREPINIDEDGLSCSGYSVDCVSRVFERLPDSQQYVKGILDELDASWSRKSPGVSTTPASAFLKTIIIDSVNLTQRTRTTDDKRSYIQFSVEFLRVFSRMYDDLDEQKAILLPIDTDIEPLQYFHQQFLPGQIAEPMEETYWPSAYEDIWNHETEPHIKASLSYSFARVQSLFLTNSGRLGSGPAQMRAGDMIFVLPFCNVPVVLREVDDHYLLVGVCFMLGLMDGEVANSGDEDGLKSIPIKIY